MAYLEHGAPRVGGQVLDAVGRVFPAWDEDTPLRVLTGGDPPPVRDTPTRQQMVQILTAAAPDTDRDQFTTLLDEYSYFASRLRDNPDDFPRLMGLLETYHRLKIRDDDH